MSKERTCELTTVKDDVSADACVRSLRISFAALALLWGGVAFAHDGSGLPGGFEAGFWHPLSGLDHLLAMIAVGLWGAFLGRPLIIALPMIFPMMMVVGAGAAMAGLPMLPVEIGIALSVLVLGSVIVFAVRAPVGVACVIVAAFALFHGFAHGTELPAAVDPIGYSAGFVLCTGLLHVLGIGLGTLRSRQGGQMVLRASGGAIALCGIWFLRTALIQ